MWLIIGLTMILLFNLFNQQPPVSKEINYSVFMANVEAGDVAEVAIAGDVVIGTTRSGDKFKSIVPLSDSELLPVLRKNGVNIKVDPKEETPWYITLMVSWFPMLLLIGVWIFFMRQMQAGGGKAMSFGKSKARLMNKEESKITFADVAGIDEAKEELSEIIEFLKDPKKFTRLGGRIPKGVLLMGSPGTGKTLLAKAIAGEAEVPFFTISGSDFVEMFVGVGASRVRDLFTQGKKNAPCIIFIDEIDAVGRHRGAGLGGGHDEREQTLNQLLVEMDGFDSSKGVIIMAATNRPDVLDQALVRPGRFDRQVVVDRPDLKGREEILRVHARGVALDPSVELRTIAARTPGFTGADLENVVNEAALLAARREKNSVTEDELEEAIDRASMGLERKSRVMSPKEKTRVASHEMGHALVAHYCDNLDPVHRVTIIPRGTAALGLTMTRPLEDRYLATEPELRDMLAFAMGGRAAEEIVFDEVSTGAQNDLEKATQVARAMVAQYGMSDEVGPLSLGLDDPNAMFTGPKISGGTAEKIDKEVLRLLNDAHDRAERILLDKRELLDRLSELLLVTETIDGADLEAYATGAKKIPNPEVVREETERKAAAAAVAKPPEPVRPVTTPAHRHGLALPPAPPMPAD
jgi:cell division protease FtsH